MLMLFRVTEGRASFGWTAMDISVEAREKINAEVKIISYQAALPANNNENT